MKKPAHRGAKAGLSNAFLAGSTDRSSVDRPTLQALYIANRFGISLAHASVVAEQAFAVPDTWGSRA